MDLEQFEIKYRHILGRTALSLIAEVRRLRIEVSGYQSKHAIMVSHYNEARAHTEDETTRRIAEWLRNHGAGFYCTPDTIADAIERGDWRK